MTSKHGRLSILVVTLTLSACTTAGGAPSSDATQPPVAIQPAPVIVPPSAVVASPTPTPVPSASPEASSGDVASGKPTAGPTDPCSTLTQAEASQLIGVALGPGKRQVADPDTICTWAKGTTEVKVFLTAPTTPAAAKAYYEAHKSEIPAGAHHHRAPGLLRWLSDRQGVPTQRDHRRDLRHRRIELLRAVLRHACLQ